MNPTAISHTVTGLVLSVVVAAAVTSYLIVFIRKYSDRLGLLDHPGGHRLHDRPTPLVGGVAMCVGFLIGILFLPVGLAELRALAAASALLMIVGVLDDLHDLSSRARFAAQISAGLLISFWGGVVLRDLGNLVSNELVVVGSWSVALTVFSVVGVVNALNMADGVDGLAGSAALLTSVFLIINASMAGSISSAMVLSVLCAVVLVFLLFNLSSGLVGRKVFMGDAGSMFLGLTLSWFLISMSQGDGRSIQPVTALWLLALPLFDTISVMVHRIVSLKSPFRADRQHVHHVLKRMGMKDRKILAIMIIFSVLFGSVGTTANIVSFPQNIMFFLFITIFFVYYLVMTILWARYPSMSS